MLSKRKVVFCSTTCLVVGCSAETAPPQAPRQYVEVMHGCRLVGEGCCCCCCCCCCKVIIYVRRRKNKSALGFKQEALKTGSISMKNEIIDTRPWLLSLLLRKRINSMFAYYQSFAYLPQRSFDLYGTYAFILSETQSKNQFCMDSWFFSLSRLPVGR